MPELPGAHVHRHAQTLRVRIRTPRHQLGTGCLQHPLPQGEYEPCLLCQWNKFTRRHHAFDGVHPPHQGFDAGDGPIGGHHRLVIQHQLLFL